MTMTKTNITDLVHSFAHSKSDSTTRSESYDDTLYQLALRTGPFCDTEAFTPTDGTAEYSYPTDAIRLLAVFIDTKHLMGVSSKELETYSSAWRATSEDTPFVHTFYERDARKTRLFPTPSTTDADGGTFLFTETRESDIPEWLVLPIMFLILEQELSYPSDHQDKEFAENCALLAKFLRGFCGVL